MRRAVGISLVVLSCGPQSTVEVPDVERRPSEPPPASYGAEHLGFTLPDDRVCKRNEDGTLKNPIAPGTYQGVLRQARCRQQKFLTMAYLAETLGVACDHCHVPDPDDPKRERYELWTEPKRTANWMYRTFVQGLRRVDGAPVTCEDCHVDRETEQPRLRILGEPRSEERSVVWMHEVMASEFVQRNGERLRCKTCHVGMAPGTEDWTGEVIRRLRYDGGLVRVPSPLPDPAESTTTAPPAATTAPPASTTERPDESATDGGDEGAPEPPQAPERPAPTEPERP